MSLPNYLINLARQLSVDQMRSLQLNLNFVDYSDREEKLRKIEEILNDYGLPVEGLSESQILGFANFVNSL